MTTPDRDRDSDRADTGMTRRSTRGLPQWPGTVPAAGFRGIYVNLDRATDRRRRMEDQLVALALDDAYVRLPAVDGRTLDMDYPAAVGCYRSHAAAVRMACRSDLPVNIVEDDTRLSPFLPAFVRHAADTGLLERYDIVFTELWVDPDIASVDPYETALSSWLSSGREGPQDYTVTDVAGLRVGAMSSYVLGQRGARRLSEVIGPHAASPPGAIDAYIDLCVREGRLRAAVVVPFLTVADEALAAFSDIQDIGSDLNRFMLKVREAFFVENAEPARTLAWVDSELAVAYRRLGEAPARLAFLRRFRNLLEERRKKARTDESVPSSPV